MDASNKILTIFLGDDVTQKLLITLNGVPVDLTTAQDIQITFANNADQTSPTYTASMSGGQIALDPNVQGGIILTLPNSVTSVFQAVTLQDLDVVVVMSRPFLNTTAPVFGNNPNITPASVAGVVVGNYVTDDEALLKPGTTVTAINSGVVTLSHAPLSSFGSDPIHFGVASNQTYRVSAGLTVLARTP